MHLVYILKSIQHKEQHYTGSTSKTIEERVKRHNQGDYAFTKKYRPWTIVYTEPYKSRSAAIKRERYLKTGIGREEVKRILEQIHCPVV